MKTHHSASLAVFAAVLHLFAFGQDPSLTAEEERSKLPLVEKFDADGDGILSGGEIPGLLREWMDRLDRDGDGKLSSNELSRVPERAVKRVLGSESSRQRAPRKPGEAVAPPARGEWDGEQLEIGGDAPDFTLPLRDGSAEVTLSSFEGKKPVVLIFGSITCSPFRQRVMGVKPIFDKYRDQAEFLMVYIREAHPESVIEVREDGKKALRKFEQTDDFASRVESANHCAALLGLPWPVLVDRADNRVKEAYAGWPIRLLVVGEDGKLEYDGGPGPGGFRAEELAEWLAANGAAF